MELIIIRGHCLLGLAYSLQFNGWRNYKYGIFVSVPLCLTLAGLQNYIIVYFISDSCHLQPYRPVLLGIGM